MHELELLLLTLVPNLSSLQPDFYISITCFFVVSAQSLGPLCFLPLPPDQCLLCTNHVSFQVLSKTWVLPSSLTGKRYTNNKIQWLIKAILKKNKVGGLALPNFETYCKTILVKTVWHWHRDRCLEKWNRIEGPEISPSIYGQLIFDKGSRITCWERTTFSTNGSGTPGQPHAKEKSGPSTSYHM